ncbi:MAG TPA: hemolysin family protein [Anaerolineaceae bacterium]|nr:hemolysin family protein [Anaerolineaceae bacterium]
MNNPAYWILLAVFVLLDLVFAAVRASLINASVPELLDLRVRNARAVDHALRLLEKPRTRATIRFSLALMHILVTAVVAWLLVEKTPPLDLGWLLLIVTGIALLILLLEFLAERLVLADPTAWAIRLLPWAVLMDFFFSPFATLLTAILGSPAGLERRIGRVTEDELKTWVEEGQPEGGGLEKGERQMIYSIFQFGDTICREIMIPRMDVLALDVDATLDETLTAVRESGHSRLPVYEDNIDNIIGLLYAKDLLRLDLQAGAPEVFSLRPLLRPAYFVPEAKKVDTLLEEMQDQRFHMAIVVDEYGGTAGLVTLEDIVEEIIGEVRDEYDQAEELSYEVVSPDEYLLQGRVDLDMVNMLLGTRLVKESGETLSGYIYGNLGRVPLQGAEILIEGWTLQVEQVLGRRIRKVRAVRRPPEEEPEEKNHEETRH